MREADERYFDRLDDRLDEALAVARSARAQGKDPTPEVEIPVAEDMADRVENLLGIPGVAARVRELEGDLGREAAALELARDFAEGRVGDYQTREGKIEGAVRTAVALLTEGVVAAPIEGIDRVELATNDDGTEFVRVFYAGPIRSAGGTAQALSVLVADYVRSLLGIDRYKPRREEIERYAEEVALYDAETGLQYSPKPAETKYIARHCPVMLDGEPTGGEEVSGYRDLERVATNMARGGMCLVLAEGIALKPPKIKRYTRQLEEVDWPWLDDLIDGRVTGDEDAAAETTVDGVAVQESPPEPEPAVDADPDAGNGPSRPDPDGKYLRDLIAGRPVFGHPSAPGGFRLRYGRARNHGFATAGVHPATMHLVDDFLATGTQLKTERPGKAAGVVPVDSIDGPTVRLATGEVRRINDPETARELRNGVVEILDLGEYLVNYGEFVENNHPLAPASYVTEWWIQDLESAGVDVQALEDAAEVDLDRPSVDRALGWAEEYDAPLHPAYTYLWHDLAVDDLLDLAEAIEAGAVVDRGDGHRVLQLPAESATTTALEALLVPHHQGDPIAVETWRPLVRTLGFDDELSRDWSPAEVADLDGPMAVLEEVAPYVVRERAPTRIGSRMGRPEKSEVREMSPAVHGLFPLGEAGGDQRDVGAAARHADGMRDTPGEVEVDVGRRRCPDCAETTFRPACPACGAHTEPEYRCRDCEAPVEPDDADRLVCPRCEGEGTCVERRTIDVGAAYRDALEAMGERATSFEILKGVKGLMSATKTPEPLEKGVLRAAHGVSTFKDGTVRYDMTDLPVTSVRPAEVGLTAERFRELGYREDVDGAPLEYDNQLVPLRAQDVVLSTGAADHLVRVADFVDDLLERFYGLDPFYDVDGPEDLVGELVFGLAPHTSAAVVGRVVGFADAAVGYAHPYFHAAKRRNCFHPDTKLWFEDEQGEWHYGRISAFVEDRLVDPREDDFGTLVQELDGELTVPAVDASGQQTRSSVSAVSRHPAPENLVEVETESGRSLRVTPDHTMLRWSDELERVAASELVEGDRLPVYVGGATTTSAEAARADGGRPGVPLDPVTSVDYISSDVAHTYCLTVEETHSLVANGLFSGQCDGDEDSVMLLMDGLLNFSKSYLPDRRGGSVAEDSRLVAVDPDGDVHFMTFGDFWGTLDSQVNRDGKFEKRACFLEGWRTFAFDAHHRASLRPIEKAIRYPADEDESLLRIETQFGRSIDITSNHSLFRYDDGIEEVAGDSLAEGDLIVAPRQLDIDPETTAIDVASCLDEPYVFIDDDVEEFLLEVRDATKRGSSTHQAFANGLSYRLGKAKISLERFEGILEEAGSSSIRNGVQIGRAGSRTGLNRTIQVDENFAWLLGMFVAEGTLSSNDPCIHNSDQHLIDRIIDTAKDTLGIRPRTRWSNRAYEVRFPAVFEDVLVSLGFESRDSCNSSEKVVPPCILKARRRVVIAFLRGLLAGDGHESSDDNVTTIGFHTTSEDVKDGVVFLLHRLGLVANISHKTDRPGNRQPIYTVTVSGGANDNPFRRILEGDDPYRPKSLVVSIPSSLMEIREMEIEDIKRLIPESLKRSDDISLEKLREIVDELENRKLPEPASERLGKLRTIVDGDLSFLRVNDVDKVSYNGYLYDLQVGGEPVFTANWLYAHNSMDAPLVMSSRIDPTEIDDEAHNMDIVDAYPREFYEATRRLADPGEVDIRLAGDTLDTDDALAGFAHTHDTSNIALGPRLSAYKTLGAMTDKLEAQLELARKLRGVDEADVAERIIEYHFLPDLLGNLRAFSRQETRCLDCGTKYRRMPLTGNCRQCDGNVTLTVHEGSVSKYLETALRVAEEYDVREYTRQRLRLLERTIESVFVNEKDKQTGIADFM